MTLQTSHSKHPQVDIPLLCLLPALFTPPKLRNDPIGHRHPTAHLHALRRRSEQAVDRGFPRGPRVIHTATLSSQRAGQSPLRETAEYVRRQARAVLRRREADLHTRSTPIRTRSGQKTCMSGRSRRRREKGMTCCCGRTICKGAELDCCYWLWKKVVCTCLLVISSTRQSDTHSCGRVLENDHYI